MRNTTLHIICLSLCLLCLSIKPAFADDSAANAGASFSTQAEISHALMSKKSSVKEDTIQFLSSNEQNTLSLEESVKLLNAWLAGDLYLEKETQQLYLIESLKTGATATQLFDASQTLEIKNRRDFTKVRSTNKLRSQMKTALANMQLSSDDVALRLNAIQELTGNLDDTTRAALVERQAKESDADVLTAIEFALAVDDASQTKAIALDTRLAAIETLSSAKTPLVYSTLTQILNQEFGEDTKAVHQAAQKGLTSYEQSQKVAAGVETLFFGLSLGSVLVLAGIGLAITFGVMGVINMAHGELIMIGAYTTYVVQQLLPNSSFSLILSIPTAFIITALVGILIERLVIRRLYGRPLETLLATFGISLILQQGVRSIFSPLNRSVTTPEWMSGALEINPMLSITYSRLYIIVFALVVFFGLMMILKRTPLGLQVRAVSQNRAMARAMGVHSERVDSLTFGLGAGIAGVAGVALSQLTNVGPSMGQDYIIDSFMVVVFGGVGNLWGTLVAGFSLGILNKVMEPWVGAVVAKILILAFIILFIQKRPLGLFPQKGRMPT